MTKDARNAYRRASSLVQVHAKGRWRTWPSETQELRISGSMGHTMDSNISYGAKRRTGFQQDMA